ncbi:HlyD family type I secretion periplasmic adaptor subunit [Oleisolibacter albus]|uniref:HlyD family type I secretion periplasmic adaptor subunit n=1 Tax=Oleisolibacter albus TaxID=2171757 RepID=UPI000DF119F6|nr:HlyD family type I secretion periplasmic adaptor subunit [Oleisolibacter albus]
MTTTMEHPATKGPGIDTSFRSSILAGAAVLGVAFGGFGLWAALAPLSSAAIAPGVVAVSSSNKQIQHLEGGIIAAIRVRDGERVAAGDVLIDLDPTRARSQVEIVRGQLDAALAQQARLQTERDGGTEIGFPPDLLARQQTPDIAALINGQNAQFEARRLSREGQVTILGQRKAQAEEQIRGLEAQQKSQERQIALIEDELKGLRELNSKGYAPRTRILALEREASRLLGERGQLVGEIAKTRQLIAETELQVVQVRKTFQEDVANQLRDVQTQVYDLRERLRAAGDVLERTTVRAPTAGTVAQLQVHTVGGVVPPGQTMLQVVPDQDELVVEAQMQVTDVDNVRIGMPADVHFSAFKQAVTPVLEGTVSYISPDRIVDPRTGAPYYSVRITVSDVERSRLGTLTLMPGMPAEAYIKTGERTALHYLVQPLTQVIDRSFKEQ